MEWANNIIWNVIASCYGPRNLKKEIVVLLGGDESDGQHDTLLCVIAMDFSAHWYRY